jgi:hypothetical protein
MVQSCRLWKVRVGARCCLSAKLRISFAGPEDIEFAEWHSKGNAIVAGSKGYDNVQWLGEASHNLNT